MIEEIREWCRLWIGFPGALIRGLALIVVVFVAVRLLW